MTRGGIAFLSAWLSLLVVYVASGSDPPGDVSASPSAAIETPPDSAEGPPKPPDRLREGTVWTDRLGRFESADPRVVFHCADDERSYTALENLALERVARAISDAPDGLRWSVSGVVTEFNGQNYLLITRVVLKSGDAAE